jgi:hypothetical protein
LREPIEEEIGSGKEGDSYSYSIEENYKSPELPREPLKLST